MSTFVHAYRRGDFLSQPAYLALLTHIWRKAHSALPWKWQQRIRVLRVNHECRRDQKALRRFNLTAQHDRGDHAR